MTVQLFRYHPEIDDEPYMDTIEIDDKYRQTMVLDVLEHLKQRDTDITYRRSCREGVCGSDGMNINGKNGLACITPVSDVIDSRNTLILRPLSGMPIIRDLVVDQTQFFRQFEKIRPYLINDDTPPTIERLQSPGDREKLDGLYECILCACCSSACPSWWWNPDKYIGPAGLIQAYRFLIDSRDTATVERLSHLEDPFSVFRCREIGNCTWVCPKGLNPMKAIGHIKVMLLKHGI
ncbi:succinate dehydrogenase iron-sulfur subunit [Halomonas sp. GXIMD04776]|uniref:succinate dehydrogenase iron-sulfur subunit n=1 Tax=Halomonas sp. GXIMD04776 TaxID=3415605 RepID=UPI003CC26B89